MHGAPWRPPSPSLTVRNYRIWAGGAIVSNVGTWMQRVAQDWLVLTQLTNNSAVAVGITTALQFGPQLVLGPLTGAVADRFPQRAVLAVTQALMGTWALLLGLLVVLGDPQLWQVYVLAGLLGVTSAFDAPRPPDVRHLARAAAHARHTPSASTAPPSTVRGSSAPPSPACSSPRWAPGWVFLINAVTFAATFGSLMLIAPRRAGARPAAQARSRRHPRGSGLRPQPARHRADPAGGGPGRGVRQ
ncbi:MAG: MFS transporter [Quadrisphaera sp.]